MKKSMILLGIAASLGVVVSMVLWSGDNMSDPVPAVSTASKPAPVSTPAMGSRKQAAAMPPAVPVIQPARGTVPAATDIDQSAPAADTMAAAREHGDPRSPDITRVKETDEPPTAAELADPKLYQAYEKRQAMKGYTSYVAAVNDALPVQEAALEQAKAEGMPPDQVARAEEKIRMMQQTRDQLLADHPGLGQ